MMNSIRSISAFSVCGAESGDTKISYFFAQNEACLLLSAKLAKMWWIIKALPDELSFAAGFSFLPEGIHFR
jgi:hypothetical protein